LPLVRVKLISARRDIQPRDPLSLLLRIHLLPAHVHLLLSAMLSRPHCPFNNAVGKDASVVLVVLLVTVVHHSQIVIISCKYWIG